MKQSLQREQFSPILYFLQNNKIPDLIRIMFNRKLSQEYLVRYGKQPEPLPTKAQENQIENYVKNFTARKIVHLKGSHSYSVKYHVNSYLQECLRRKLKINAFLTPQERKSVWLQLTQYYQLPTLFSGLDQLQLPQEMRRTIKKDVDRTFLSKDMLKKQNPEKQQFEMRGHLTSILQKFAKYNPYIGYCQGMNNIVLFLIEQGFDDQQSFFIFKKITQQLLPCDYYSTMNSVVAFMKLLCEVMAQTHPSTVQKMKVIVKNNGGEGITLTTAFVIQWFICLFTNTNLNRDMRRCVMDHFLLQGLPALLKAALCYFDVIQPVISKVSLFEEFNPIVEKTIKDYSNLNHLRQCLNNRYINKSLFDLILDKLTGPSQKRRRHETKNSCNRRWTMCLETIEDHFSSGYSNHFFVFKTAEEPKIIEDYFTKQKPSYFRIGKNPNKTDQLRLGRMEHSCRPSSGTSLTYDIEDNHSESLGIAQSHCLSESPHSKRSTISKRHQLQQPQKRQLVRTRALKQLQNQHSQRQSVLARSDSIMFMRHMIQNESFTNLMNILEVQEMDDLFRECISENEEEDNV